MKGVDDNGIFFCQPDEIKRRLDIMADLGVQFLRVGFYWLEIERSKGEYTWESDVIHYDTVVTEATIRGIQIIGIFAGAPNLQAYPSFAKLCYRKVNGVKTDVWTNVCPNDWTQEQYLDWMRFVKTVAQKYKHSISHWEVWNEPNLNEFWNDYADLDYSSSNKNDIHRCAAGYVRLLKNTSIAVRGEYSNPQNCQIISAGINRMRCKYEHYPFHWLCTSKEYIDYFFEEVCKQGAWTCFQYFGIHPYRTNTSPQPGPKEQNSKYAKFNPYIGTLDKELRTLTNCYLRGTKIFITEIGWESGVDTPESFQARNVSQTLEICKSRPDVHACVWFNFIDGKLWTTGLVRENTMYKLSAFAYKES